MKQIEINNLTIQGKLFTKYLDMNTYLSTAFNDKWFIDWLYDYNLMPILKSLPKDIIYKSYNYLLKAYKNPATTEGFLNVCYALFGKKAEVLITVPSPQIINVEITNALKQYNYALKVNVKNGTIFEPFTLNTNNKTLLASYYGEFSGGSLKLIVEQFIPIGVILNEFKINGN